ncbi:MAG TPA: hypothetical protein VG898_12330 [Solirubrobacterales bacterium]|nr:hypothetical protein [Solirubrobacterales bacterium]
MDFSMTLDPTSAALAAEVRTATEHLVEVASAQRDWLPTYELQSRAQNGTSPGAVALALNALIEEGRFEFGERDLIRLKA